MAKNVELNLTVRLSLKLTEDVDWDDVIHDLELSLAVPKDTAEIVDFAVLDVQPSARKKNEDRPGRGLAIPRGEGVPRPHADIGLVGEETVDARGEKRRDLPFPVPQGVGVVGGA